VNARLVRRPWILNALGARLTVVDAYGSPGDTLLTATVCRHLRHRYRRLRLNCLTPNPELLAHDPNVDTVNGPESYLSAWSWYPGIVHRRDGRANVLSETLARFGLDAGSCEYRARVYLTREELAAGFARIADARRPVLTFHTRTNQTVKDWPIDRWQRTLATLAGRFELVHLGDAREPEIAGVRRLAGRLTLRESLAVLAHARVHLGGDSFLMHAANGLGVPSVIVFGGSRTPANVGYAENANLFVTMACGPCWIHENQGERCAHGVACMERIAPEDVLAAVDGLCPRSAS
jgi:ADP-heptose:LPS heptosyltransferase